MTYTATVDGVSSAYSYFNSGAYFPPGSYTITYQTGAYASNLASNLWIASCVVTDGSDNSAAICPASPYSSSQAAAQTIAAGSHVTFNHVGGQIAVINLDPDGDFSNNGNGSPNPTFRLSTPGSRRRMAQWQP